jgi:hypothetical protein
MDEKKLKKHFSLAAARPQIRDKDNAQPRVKPPAMARVPQPNLAPPGMVGIRSPMPKLVARSVPKAEAEKAPAKFSLDRRGYLTRTFKPLAAKKPEPGRDR